MGKKVLTAAEYNKMMRKAKAKAKQRAKIKAKFKKIVKNKKVSVNLSNETRCKIVSTIGAFVCLSAVTFGASRIGRLVLYGSFFNSKDQPEHVYMQDEFLPAGYFNEHPLRVAVSNDFSEKEFSKIKSGIENLDGYAEGIKFEIVRTSLDKRKDDEQIVILKDTQGEVLSKNENGVAKSLKEKTKIEDYHGTIYLNKDVSINIIEKMTMHEILHILDFQHENDLRSIMFAGSGRFSTPPTKKDIENINTKFPSAEQ